MSLPHMLPATLARPRVAVSLLLLVLLALGDASRPVAAHRNGALDASAAAVDPERFVPEAPLGPCPAAADGPGAWRAVSDLPWAEASTGWSAIVDMVKPERDVSFSRNPIVLSGQPYEKGLGVYPPSDVSYDLGGRYTAFTATVGINDDAPPGAAAVFLVRADGLLVYTSGKVTAHGGLAQVELCVAGVRRLTLSVALPSAPEPGNAWPPDAGGAAAVWAAARLFEPAAPSAASASAAGAVRETLDGTAGSKRERVIGELGGHQASSRDSLLAARRALGLPEGAALPERTTSTRSAAGAILANRHLVVTLGTGGDTHARLSAIDPLTGAAVLEGAASAVSFEGRAIDLARDTQPDGADPISFEPVDDPALGPGMSAALRVRPRDGLPEARTLLRVTLFDGGPYLTYQVLGEGAWSERPSGFVYLAAGGPALVAGDDAGAMVDASYLRTFALEGDGVTRHTRLGLGKPAAVWGQSVPGRGQRAGSVIFSLLDEQRLPAWLVTRRDPGRAAAVAGIAQPLPAGDRPATDPAQGPLLLVELAPTQDMREALSHYRAVMARLYPPAPLPPWVRYQWGSWWTYGSGVNEPGLRLQVDTIAERLGDLGPWHIIVDAGWQDVGPTGSGDLARAVPEKFPQGLRSFVDYAHSRGVRVLLFYSAVYTHDGTGTGEWLGLPALISGRRDWFRRLNPEGTRPARYVFDYRNPEVRQYLSESLTRFVTEYDADGVKIDGLGDAEGHLIPFWERVTYEPRRWSVTPVMDIYRLAAQAVSGAKPDAFIESGWLNPAMAQPLAHAFRFGDEWNTFSSQYPFPGLAEHFSYAAFQRGVLGQRPNVGAAFGGLERPLSQEWLGAALGLGAHVSLAGDLQVLSPVHLAQLRALLVNYRPFAGTTRTGGGQRGTAPEWAATTVDGLTFLSAMNQGDQPRSFTVDLAEAGLPSAGEAHLLYDVTSGAASRVSGAMRADVPPRALRLFILRRTPGVFWSTSSYEAEPIPGGERLRVRGPAMVDGSLRYYSPGGAPPQVLLDGAPLPVLAPGAAPATEWFSYDAGSGVVTLSYYHRGEGAFPQRTIEIRR